MKCNSCGCEFPEGKPCPNCGTKLTDLTDLYSRIEKKYGHNIEYANFLKEILNICIKYKEEDVGTMAILTLLDSFIKILENSSTDYSIFQDKPEKTGEDFF